MLWPKLFTLYRAATLLIFSSELKYIYRTVVNSTTHRPTRLCCKPMHCSYCYNDAIVNFVTQEAAAGRGEIERIEVVCVFFFVTFHIFFVCLFSYYKGLAKVQKLHLKKALISFSFLFLTLFLSFLFFFF